MSDIGGTIPLMGSVAVGQGQLLEPPPVRELQVPPGRTAHWGVDPSTLRVSIAYVDGEGRRGVATAPFARSEGPARLSAIYAETRRFVRSLYWDEEADFTPLDGGWPLPGVVLIEQPSGKMENPSLSYAVGVIQAAVHDGLMGHSRIETVTSSHWKKVACGRGDLFKPKRKTGYYGVLDWACQQGYAGSSWDEADAMGIAECARREIRLVEF